MKTPMVVEVAAGETPSLIGEFIGETPVGSQPHRCFQSEVLRLYFLTLETWVAQSVLLHSCSSLSALECGTTQSSCHYLACPGPPATTLLRVLFDGCPSLALLPVWMNVSSLTPWSSDFHIARFSGSFGCFFVFKFVVVLLLVV